MPTNAVFLDTGGWLALLNADDHLHTDATAILQQLGQERRPLVTTDWVIAETGNGLARKPARQGFRAAVESFDRAASSTVMRVDAALFLQSLALYDQVSDKTWGLVDCVSFVVMRDRNIMDALTPDRHFEKAGFNCLLPTV